MILAALLWTSKKAEERRRILLAGIINDSFDVLIGALAMLQGDLDFAPNASLLVGPAIFVALGLAALGKDAKGGKGQSERSLWCFPQSS